jgi:hypothetical protein
MIFMDGDLDSFDFQLILKIDNQAMLKAQHNSKTIVYLISMENQKDFRRQKHCLKNDSGEKSKRRSQPRCGTKKRRGAAEPAPALESVLIAIQELSPSREIP